MKRVGKILKAALSYGFFFAAQLAYPATGSQLSGEEILVRAGAAMRQSFSADLLVDGQTTKYYQRLDASGFLETRTEPFSSETGKRGRIISITNREGKWHLHPTMKLAVRLDYLASGDKSTGLEIPEAIPTTSPTTSRYEVTNILWRETPCYVVTVIFPASLVSNLIHMLGNERLVSEKREYVIDSSTFFPYSAKYINRSGVPFLHFVYDQIRLNPEPPTSLFVPPPEFSVKGATSIHEYGTLVRNQLQAPPPSTNRTPVQFKERLGIQDLRAAAQIFPSPEMKQTPLKPVVSGKELVTLSEPPSRSKSRDPKWGRMFVLVFAASSVAVLIAILIQTRNKGNQRSN